MVQTCSSGTSGIQIKDRGDYLESISLKLLKNLSENFYSYRKAADYLEYLTKVVRLSLHIYHFSIVVDLSSEKYNGTSREIYNEDADGETRTCNPSLCWFQEFLCPVEPLYYSDEKSTTVEMINI